MAIQKSYSDQLMDQHAKTIIRLREEDLALRSKLMHSGELQEGYNSEMEALHNRNAAILQTIIEEIGYPTIDRVGEEASQAAWLVIQHAISQPAFMESCLDLLATAIREKQASPIDYAYLSDRVSMFRGKPQLYGTQFDWDESGQLSPKPYDNRKLVDQRRKQLGMNSLEEQTTVMRNRARQEGDMAPNDFAARKSAYDEWRRRVGWDS